MMRTSSKDPGHPWNGYYPSYPFYVVTPEDNRIVSGWDFKEDAQDNVKELREDSGIICKVLTKRGWLAKHPKCDPRMASHWYDNGEWVQYVGKHARRSNPSLPTRKNPSPQIKWESVGLELRTAKVLGYTFDYWVNAGFATGVVDGVEVVINHEDSSRQIQKNWYWRLYVNKAQNPVSVGSTQGLDAAIQAAVMAALDLVGEVGAPKAGTTSVVLGVLAIVGGAFWLANRGAK